MYSTKKLKFTFSAQPSPAKTSQDLRTISRYALSVLTGFDSVIICPEKLKFSFLVLYTKYRTNAPHTRRILPLRTQAQGFTIIELMIATLVFSIVLIVVMSGVMFFTRSYYKGVYTASTQTAARAIVDQVAQAIQFGTVAPTGSGLGDSMQSTENKAICASGYVFSARRGVLYDPTVSATNGLYVAKNADPASCNALWSGGQQLLGKNMRLTQFEVKDISSDMYSVAVKVAYGDADLLCAPDLVSGSCAETAQTLSDEQLSNAPDAICKPSAGKEFCAVASLQSQVQRRVTK